MLFNKNNNMLYYSLMMFFKKLQKIPYYLAIILVFFSSITLAQATLELVKQNGLLRCGVNSDLPGFSSPDELGQYIGFDVDFCRAIAAAVLGDANAIEFVTVNAQQRFTKLSEGDYEVLIRNTTWTSSRDTQLGLNFVQTTFYDGQGIIVRRNSNISSLADLDNTDICVTQGTTSERNLADAFRENNLNYNAIIFEQIAFASKAFEENLCDAFTTDKSSIAGLRSRFKVPEDFIILDETLSKEPLGPVVRHGDDEWFDIVQWVVFSLIYAEEWGLTSQNVGFYVNDNTYKSIQLLLNAENSVLGSFGLDANAMVNMLSQVGNYGEIYERHFGETTPTAIPRGLNELWLNGGILYSPPFSSQ